MHTSIINKKFHVVAVFFIIGRLARVSATPATLRQATKIENHIQANTTSLTKHHPPPTTQQSHHEPSTGIPASPCAATTYYFKELSDLIHDSFLYFAEDNFASLKALESMSYELLKTHSDNITTDFLVDQLSDYLAQHILNQTKDYDSRLLEHAFKTEALRNEHLAKVLRLLNCL